MEFPSIQEKIKIAQELIEKREYVKKNYLKSYLLSFLNQDNLFFDECEDGITVVNQPNTVKRPKMVNRNRFITRMVNA